jgi:Dihaem cytochrome c
LSWRTALGRGCRARRFSDPRRLAAGVAVIALIAALEAAFGVARSDTESPGPLEPGNARAPAELKQCGDCHMVFPSRMLPSRSWTAILSTMDNHFGEDAAIPKQDLDVIRDFLTAYAADAPGATVRERHYLGALLPDNTPLRITATPWWNQMHADFNFDGVKRSQVKSPANCLACHNNSNVVQ